MTTNEPAAGPAVDVAESAAMDGEGMTAAITSATEVCVTNGTRPAKTDPSGPKSVGGESAGPLITTAQAPEAARITVGRRAHLDGLRLAAQALLDAWDSRGGTRDNDAQGLTDAIAALRTTLAATVATARPCDNSKGRSGTKQAQVLAMLGREEGASGPQIAEAMGGAPHTVRGFLAGLAKKGIAVEVLDRIRQVGPNQQGAKGSYTVYRLVGRGDSASRKPSGTDQSLRLSRTYANAPVCPKDSPLLEGVV